MHSPMHFLTEITTSSMHLKLQEHQSASLLQNILKEERNFAFKKNVRTKFLSL